MNFNTHYAKLIGKGICFIVAGDKLLVKSIYKSHLSLLDKEFIKKHKLQIMNKVKEISALLLAKQSNMLFAEELYENPTYNNIVYFLEISGQLRINILEKAINDLITRHDALRSYFYKTTDGFYLNTILPQEKVNFKLDRIKHTTNNTFEQFTQQIANYQFDLSRELPIKITLYQHTAHKYSLFFILHHVITDGWSLSVMLSDLDKLYHKRLNNDSSLLEDLPFNYRDYLNWEIAYTQITPNKNISYWQEKLNNSNQLLNLPIIQNNKYPINSGASEWFFIHDDTCLLLQEFCAKYSISVFTVILTIFYWVLRVYSGDNAINIGTAVANRKFQSVEAMLGFFIDVMVLPIDANLDQINSFINLGEFVQNIFTDAMEHQVDINEILPDLTFARPLQRKPLFQVMYLHQNNENNYKNLFGLHAERKYIKPNHSLFDIIFETRETNSKLECCLQYRQDILSKDFIYSLIETIQYSFKQLLSNPEAKLSSISMVTDKQYDLIINQFNQTDKPYPKHKTIHQLFEEQVAKTPEDIALIFENTTLTYKALNQKANQLAKYIRKEYQKQLNTELTPDTIIGLCLDRSLEMIVGILGVLKAGGAYVPIDPNYPQARVDYILNDTQTKLILTTTITLKKVKVKTYVMEDTHHPENVTFLEEKSKLNLPKDKIIKIDFTNRYIYQEKNHELTLAQQSNTNNLAYVIYTSGTTGNPKGVMVEHLQISTFISALSEKILSLQNAPLNVLSTTNYVFDIFGLEYALPLLNGYSIDLGNNDLLQNPSHGFKLNNYNIIQLTPSKLEWFLSNSYVTESTNMHLITMLIGGEELTSQHIKLIHDYETQHKNLKFKLINAYGPTETTIWSTMFLLTNGNISIGKPLPHEMAYVLNSHMLPVPIGAIGELYIGGAGVARGYLNQTQLSNKAFISNPFQTLQEKHFNKNSRIYKTGDLVRMLPDGNIVYIGRNDEQVKINGYRIELGEIKNALLNISGIKQSCVVLRTSKINEERAAEEATKFLVGYYILEQAPMLNITHLKKTKSYSKINEKTKLTEEEVYRHLTKSLPEYMIPNYLVEMKEFPLNPNGKIDKNALPSPDIKMLKHNYIAPDNEIESTLCRIFAEILGIHEEKISTSVDFFRMGGNSILAIRASHKISQALATEVMVADIFNYKTAKNLAEYLINVSQKLVRISIPTSTAKHSLLSFAQQRLWFIEEYEEGSSAYHIPVLYQIAPNINLDGLKYGLKNIIKRHEVLRSTITELVQTNYEVSQIVHEAELEINEEVLAQKITKVEFNAIITKEISKPFDLRHEYPIRLKIYRETLPLENNITHKENLFLLVNMHHIASDGWSMEIFQQELFEFYCAYIEKRPINLPPLEIQYKDYAQWQRNYLANDSMVLKEQLAYWKKKLIGYQELELPLDYSRPMNKDYGGANMFFNIPPNLSTKLRELTKLKGTTLHIILLSIFNILLSKYTNQEEVVIGSPIANRHHHQTENLIGFFVNTLVHRTILKKNQSFTDLLEQTHQNQIEAQLHQDIPFEKLIEELNVEREASRHPIFQVMFGVQSFGTNINNNLLIKTDLGNSYSVAKFDLTLMLDDKLETIRGNFNYATSLFKENTIKGFKKHYLFLIKQLLDAPNKSISDVSLLTHDEFHKIVYVWNNTTQKYPENKTIHQLFEEQVEKTPNNVAIIFEKNQLTYKELNEKSNQLARYIRKEYKKRTDKELLPDTLIALCVDRSLEMLVGILAVLKVGGAYVPIDPNYPQERVSYILEDTNAKLILIQQHLNKQNREETHILEATANTHSIISNKISLTLPKKSLITIDLHNETIYKKNHPASKTNLFMQVGANNLAYVIYTSGTTGKPKGVMIEHSGVINLAIAQNKAFGLNNTKSNNGLFYASYVFDAHVSELFTIILFGKALHIINNDIRHDIALLSKYIIDNKIDVATIPPALLTMDYLLKLKTLIVAGDKTDIGLMNQYINNNVVVINAYGPTEITVCATLHKYKFGDLSNNIGKPIANSKVYILDNNLNPLPLGAIGELYLGGVGIARGYLNNQLLTDEKFIANPFQTELEKQQTKNILLYKTGDLVRYLPNGDIEYIGRNDFQVKIRGYRIELGEIENKFATYPGIKQVVVLSSHREINGHLHTKNRVDEPQYLVGYYVARKRLDEKNIIKYLGALLPEYMIPSVFVWLERLPLTINGKLDKSALPNPEFTHTNNYVAPRNELEASLCKIYAEVLGLPIFEISINDDFFKLGGDSIKAIRVQSLAYRHQITIRIVDIFTHKSINAICQYAIHDDNQNYTREKNMDGEIPLHPIQRWFFNLNLPNINWFNMAMTVTLEDAKLDRLVTIIETFQKLQSSFRIKFKKLNHGYSQFYTPSNSFKPTKLEIKTVKSIAEISNNLCQLQQSLNIETRLYRFVYFNITDSNVSQLIFICHHLLIDAVSLRIVADSLKEAYLNAEQLNNSTSTDFTDINSYKDFSLSLTELKNHIPQDKINRWQYISRQVKQKSKPHINYGTAYRNKLWLSSEDTKSLKNTALVLDSQLQYILLASFFYALTTSFKQDDLVILLEGYGRKLYNNKINISNTLGWFTTIYPVLLSKHTNRIIGNEYQILKQIEVDMAIGESDSGLSFGLLNWLTAKSAPILLDEQKINFAFNYLGEIIANNEWKTTMIGDFTVDENNYLPHPLSMNALIIDDKLQMNFIISPDLMNLQQLTSFMNQVQNNLLLFVNCKTNKYSYKNIPEFHPVTVINEFASSGKALTFIHTGSSGIEVYLNNLAKSLTKEIKIQLIDNLMLRTKIKITSIRELAEIYVKYLIKVQPFGPYYLGGLSFGALLAMEMANILYKKREIVAAIFLVDPIIFSDTIRHKYFNNKNMPINVSYYPKQITTIKTILFKCLRLFSEPTSGAQLDSYSETTFDMPYNGLENHYLNLHKIELDCDHESTLLDGNIHIIVNKIESVMLEKEKLYDKN